MNRAGPIVVFGAAVTLGGAAVLGQANVRLPGNRQGYEPEQPVAYSHRVHAGELKIDCLYCHFAAETSRRAGVPPAQVCMNCHATVTAGLDAVVLEREAAQRESRDPVRIVSEKLKPLYDAMAFDPATGKSVPGGVPRAIPWVRVHDLPDHVAFAHSVHVNRGVACQACHGSVETMERVRQEASLSMGWCVECHRANGREGGVAVPPVARRADPHVSTDCSVCHY